MATAAKRKFSGSTDGKAILVAAAATPGTTIHTAVAGTTAGTFDEIWLYAFNSDTVDRTITIEYGSATAPNDNITATVTTKSGLFLILPGTILQNGQVVKAFASAANVVTVHGWVNTITD